MTTADAKKKIVSFMKDIGNKRIGAEYRPQTQKWLFVEHYV